MDMVGYCEVPQHHSPSADRAVLADHGAAGYPCAAGHCGVRANLNVVANLHQIIELDSMGKHRIGESSPVYASIGADLTIVTDTDRAELFNLDPLALI